MGDCVAPQALIENLRDAGCRREDIERFLALQGESDTSGQLKLLADIRSALLEDVHRCERCIGCLDYLVFQISNGRGNASAEGML
ncbi:MAG: hypothetical protein Q4B99_04625 [Clostridia bacterium]|nr:hypothetical protein [Clostridia bacterium]